MKEKHLQVWMKLASEMSALSSCPRRKFGALLLDPERNTIVANGYNGGPRGGGALCGGDVCLRDSMNLASGHRVEIGCHHAEMNVICNAAASGVSCAGKWLMVTGEPCLMCAKLIHHAGVVKVIVVGRGYGGDNGLDYLKQHGIEVAVRPGPPDPRVAWAPEPKRPT
jgi:dCMP deaminase